MSDKSISQLKRLNSSKCDVNPINPPRWILWIVKHSKKRTGGKIQRVMLVQLYHSITLLQSVHSFLLSDTIAFTCSLRTLYQCGSTRSRGFSEARTNIFAQNIYIWFWYRELEIWLISKPFLHLNSIDSLFSVKTEKSRAFSLLLLFLMFLLY